MIKKNVQLTVLAMSIAAAFSANVAYAGQIQSSSVSIAREAVVLVAGLDTLAVTSPSIAYRFAGDVDARVQAQTFQIQFILAAGNWATLPAGIATAISMSDGVSGVIQEQGAGAPIVTNASYTVTATGLSPVATDGSRTLWATITVNQGANALVKQPLFSLNVTSNNLANVVTDVSASRASIQGLKAVAGDLVTDYTSSLLCEAVKTLPVSFKHYVALTNPAAMATDTTATKDEHDRSGSTNTATIMTFPTNVKVAVAAATGGVSLAPGGNQTFILNGAGTAFVDANNALLGTVTLVQNAFGYDTNLANQYLLGNGGAGLGAIATAVANVGDVETNNVKVTVTATQGFVVGGTLALNTAANCAVGTRVGTTGTVAITAANAAGPIDLVVANADLDAVFGVGGTGPVYACYTNPGTATIPSSVFSAVGRVVKAAEGAGFNEQDNICGGNFISLGGGLKIDVRNYIPSSNPGAWHSVIRFVNNSDSAPADVWAQIIHQDGKLGNWAKIADLPVRGVVNMSAAQIDAKLAAGSTATAVPGAAAGSTLAETATTAGTSPRLRITSTSGKSLRIQNYMANGATGQIVEASGQQGVDFEAGDALRAPVNEGQYQDQDANSGLNLSK